MADNSDRFYSVENLTLDHADGIYRSGETLMLTGTLCRGGKPVTEGAVRVLLKWEGAEIGTADIPCTGAPFLFTYRSDKPGWIYFGIQVLDAEGKVVDHPGREIPQARKRLLVDEIGAIYDPEKIRFMGEAPADLEEFWAGERRKLDAVPFDTKIETLDSGDSAVELYAVTVQAGVDRPVTAYLAYPAGAKAGSLPAYVEFLSHCWSDAHCEFAVNAAKRGALGMAATWHGFPVGRDEAFYEGCAKYFDERGGLGDRLKWSFHDVLIRTLRALDYVKSRPEWNRRDLIVQGGSLGGGEAAVAAAFDPAVTLALIAVCSFCEFDGRPAGRAMRRNIGEGTPEILKELSYYDVCNLTPLFHCESYFCAGYADEACFPSKVLAAYNNLPKELKKGFYGNPHTGHYGTTKNIVGNERIARFFRETTVGLYPEPR